MVVVGPLSLLCLPPCPQTESAEVLLARQKLAARFATSAAIGGKGSVRRKKKAVHKAAAADDKKLQATLKRLGVNNLPSIEEANLFKDDGTIIHFENPRVQASLQGNTYVISGTPETKSVHELLPGILSQLGPESMQELRKVAEKLKSMDGGAAAADDDDDVPPLEANFEAVSNA